eukprot:3175364-Amphidinium_carterae.2
MSPDVTLCPTLLQVWQFLQSRHGGGPAIQSDGALDLYKATVHPVEGSVNPSSPRALGSPKAQLHCRPA